MRVFKIYKLTSLLILSIVILNAQENRLFWDGREWNKIRKDVNYVDNIEYKIKHKLYLYLNKSFQYNILNICK